MIRHKIASITNIALLFILHYDISFSISEYTCVRLCVCVLCVSS